MECSPSHSLTYEAACINVCRAARRWRKACRCSRRETTSPMARRGRRELHNSSRVTTKARRRLNCSKATHGIVPLFDATVIPAPGDYGGSCSFDAAHCLANRSWIGRMPIRSHLLWSMDYHINGLLDKSLSCLHIPLLARAWNPPNCHPDRSPDTHNTTSHARVPVGFIDRAGCPGLSTLCGFAIDPLSTERNVLPSLGWLHV